MKVERFGMSPSGKQENDDRDARIRALTQALEEKEAVIRQLDRELKVWRALFFIPLAVRGWLRAVLSSVRQRLHPVSALLQVHGKRLMLRLRLRCRELLLPRLGRLNQYPPVLMRLPSHYHDTPMPARTPRVSVVTPSFRQGQFIERTIRSVLDQRYPALEYFIQDGGSKDGTIDVIRRHAHKLAGWESAPDAGQSQAINLGFARTTGEIMAWLNSDDLLLPGAIAAVVDYFNRHPDIDVVYGHRLLIDEDDHEIGRWMLPAHDDEVLSWADYVPQETLFWRRELWDKVGGRVDESFRFAMDWDLLIRFRDAGARFACLPRFLGAFRIHTQQKTSAEISGVGMQDMARIRERIHGRLPPMSEVHRAVLPYLFRHLLVDLGWRLRRKLGWQ